jgi:hypothetical protein
VTSFTRATVRFTNKLWEPLYFKQMTIEQTSFHPDPMPARINPRSTVELVFESNGNFDTEATFVYGTESANRWFEASVNLCVGAVLDNTFAGTLAGPDASRYNLKVDGPSEHNHVSVDVSIDNDGPGPFVAPRYATNDLLLPGLIGSPGGWYSEQHGIDLGTGHTDSIWFARRADGALIVNAKSHSSGPVSAWAVVEQCPSLIVGSPQLLVWPGDSWDTTRFRLFVTGIEGQVYAARVDSGDYAQVGLFSSFAPVPGATTSFGPAAASWQPGRLDLAVTADDGTVLHTWSTDDGEFHSWENIAGSLAGPPSMTTWGPERLDLVGRSPDLHALAHGWYSATSGFQWETLPARLDGNPSISSGGIEKLCVIASAESGDFTLIDYDRGWGRWIFAPLRCSSDPLANPKFSPWSVQVATRGPLGNYQIDEVAYPA